MFWWGVLTGALGMLTLSGIISIGIGIWLGHVRRTTTRPPDFLE